MAQYFAIHPQSPQQRLLKQAVQLIEQGNILAVPTDSSYALVCQLDDKDSAEQLRHLRGKDSKHNLTLLCRNLNELGQYAILDNKQFKLLKLATPGPYTFILPATKEVPNRVSHPAKKTIGLRVPQHPVLQALLELYNKALLSTSLIPINSNEPLNNPEDISEIYGSKIAAIIASGACPAQATTVINLTNSQITIERLGGGDITKLGIQIS